MIGLLAEWIAGARITRDEERAHVRKARVLVQLEMIAPVTDEEIAARVEAAVGAMAGVVRVNVDVRR